jgi:hypothetical protein
VLVESTSSGTPDPQSSTCWFGASRRGPIGWLDLEDQIAKKKRRTTGDKVNRQQPTHVFHGCTWVVTAWSTAHGWSETQHCAAWCVWLSSLKVWFAPVTTRTGKYRTIA